MELGEHAQFLTWRLADALPAEVLKVWEDESAAQPAAEKQVSLWRRIEAFIDSGYGTQILRKPRIADVVQESLVFGHMKNYHLHHWCVMPNHVHVLLTPTQGATLKLIMRSIKSFTAHRINELEGMVGQVWQEDYFDRWMRSEEHFSRTASYIEWNPVKAGLCQDPTLWPWSSANEIAFSRLHK